MANNFTNIKERVLYVVKSKGFSLEPFFDSIGMSYGSFKGAAKGTPLNSDAIANISTKIPDLNLSWLLKGEGEIFKTKSTENVVKQNDHKNDHINDLKPKVQKTWSNEDNYAYDPPILIARDSAGIKSLHKDAQVRVAEAQLAAEGIPLIPLDAVAGFCNGDVAQVMEYECEKYVIPSFRGAEFLIPVKGSSMYPKYSSGDIVACKCLPLDTFFQWNKVYVVDTEQGVLIKRVRRGPDDDHILLVSENERYEPFPLHKSAIHALAIVIGVIRLE